MNKVVRLTESDLIRLVKRVLSESAEQLAQQEEVELKKEITDINTELKGENIDSSKELTPDAVCQTDGKDVIEKYISEQGSKFEQYKDFVRDFLNSLKGLRIRQLINKIKEIKLLMKKNRNESRTRIANKIISEDLQQLNANPVILAAVGMFLIMGIIFMIKSGLFKPNYCRRWSRARSTGTYSL